MTVFLAHTMSSVAHTACSSRSSAECLLVSLHNASRLFWAAPTFCSCCLQNRRQTVKIKALRVLKTSCVARASEAQGA